MYISRQIAFLILDLRALTKIIIVESYNMEVQISTPTQREIRRRKTIFRKVRQLCSANQYQAAVLIFDGRTSWLYKTQRDIPGLERVSLFDSGHSPVLLTKRRSKTTQ